LIIDANHQVCVVDNNVPETQHHEAGQRHFLPIAECWPNKALVYQWVGTGARCRMARFSIPPVVTVRAAFTAYGDRLSGIHYPFFLSTDIGKDAQAFASGVSVL
jgi:hypothetical protein